MLADVYSHIIDDDRRLNAERMEAAFYSGRQATPEPVQSAATESSALIFCYGGQRVWIESLWTSITSI